MQPNSQNDRQLPGLNPNEGGNRGGLIRLRTVIWLRWAAIVGQLCALFVAQQLYALRLEVELFYLVVGSSVLANLVSMYIFPKNRRLSERENFFIVLFDLLQLGALLFLAGGLNNPFSILIVGPVAVSAAVLSSRSTIFLGVIAVAIVSVLTELYFPLRTDQGFIMRIPDIFIFGSWAAIVIAVVFLGIYVRRIASEADIMSQAYQAAQMALLREQKLTDLDGVIAATAHELGTPLATIKLTSSELLEDIAQDSEARDDVQLIHDQADRCRDILRSMGRTAKGDSYLRQAPISAVVEEAASPHLDRGKKLHFSAAGQNGLAQPEIYRKPEIIHGIRNLVQNAVDFSRENVWVEISWNERFAMVSIADDGRGFPSSLFGSIGDPFARRRAAYPRSS